MGNPALIALACCFGILFLPDAQATSVPQPAAQLATPRTFEEAHHAIMVITGTDERVEAGCSKWRAVSTAATSRTASTRDEDQLRPGIAFVRELRLTSRGAPIGDSGRPRRFAVQARGRHKPAGAALQRTSR